MKFEFRKPKVEDIEFGDVVVYELDGTVTIYVTSIEDEGTYKLLVLNDMHVMENTETTTWGLLVERFRAIEKYGKLDRIIKNEELVISNQN